MRDELLIEFVSSCNLRCKMCAFKEGFTFERLSDKSVEDIFTGVKRLNTKSRYYNITALRMDGNSEPLLYHKLPWAMDLAAEAGIGTFDITTNGVLLTRDVTHQLMQSRLSSLNVSMTGIVPSVYNGYQGYGLSVADCWNQIETIKDNIRYFVSERNRLKRQIHVTVCYIVNEDTKDHLYDYMSYFRYIGVNGMLCMTKENVHLRDKCKPYGEIMGRKSCESPHHPVVCANGDVLMGACPHEIPVLGNIREQSLEQILMSEQTERYIKAFLEIDIKNLPLNCQNCHNTHVY